MLFFKNIFYTIFIVLSLNCKQNIIENIENYKIVSIQCLDRKSNFVYTNFNINDDKINIVVANDYLPGSIFKVKFNFSENVNPVSITPSVNDTINFERPIEFTIQYSKSYTKKYVVTLVEDQIPLDRLSIDSVAVFVNNETKIYSSTSINNNKITILVENENASRINQYKLKFYFPIGVYPISITPTDSNYRNFTNPQNYTFNFYENVSKTFSISIIKSPLNNPIYDIQSAQILNENNEVSNFQFTRLGNNFIALSASANSYKLKLNFANGVTPISISPDIDVMQDFNIERKITVQFANNIVKEYTFRIGIFNETSNPNKVIRGVWVSDVGSLCLSNKDSIISMVKMCKDIGINTIFMVVYNDGKTKYPSEVMEKYFDVKIDPTYANRDPLRELIDEAKSNSIKVIAWFEYGFASVYGNSSGGKIVQKYPHWASLDKNGLITEKNNFFWLDAFNPEVQDFIRKLYVEVVTKYPDIDGVQGDDRLPALPTNGGYNQYIIKQYTLETNNPIPTNDLEQRWVQWRANKLTNIGLYLYKQIKAIDNKFIVSWSPSPYPWSLQNYLQDWIQWLRNKQVDYIHPQLYRYTANDYGAAFQQAISYIQPNTINFLTKFSPGVLLGVGSGDAINSTILEEILRLNRQQGILGETFFYIGNLIKNTSFQQTIKNNYLANPLP